MSANASLGTAAVALGFAGSSIGVLTLAAGLRRRDERLLRLGRAYSLVALTGAIAAFVVMERALLSHDFSLKYVAEHGNRAVPTLYTFASLWGALEGSIILWSLILCAYTVGVTVRFRERVTDPLVGWATLTMLGVATFFFALMLGPANPFHAVAGRIPLDGPGPNPLLQDHPLMAIHPPFLYLGYVGFTVPFAFCVAALVTGRVGEGWLAATRRWTLVSWGFLTIGIVLGAWWSYEVLGWGGFWAWDPVENASFLPWLTGTAYIHSVMVQERRGMLRVWNLSLLLATFSLTILGTFLTRSGVLDSVHSFTESPIGAWLLSFFGIIVAISLGLIAWRGDRLRSPGRVDSPLSREGAFLANNILFAAFAFVVLFGTVFPLVYEALKGDSVTVGRPYFDRMTLPIGLALLFLMAIAPVLPWRKASSEVLRTRLLWPAWAGAGALVLAVVIGARGLAPLVAFGLGGFAAGSACRQLVLAARAARRSGASPFGAVIGRANGGMIVHLGVIVVAVAFTSATSFSHGEEVRLKPNETARPVAGHTVTYLGTEREETARKTTIKARVRVDGGQVFAPALNRFPNATQTIGTPSVKIGIRRDVYLTFVEAPKQAGGSVVIGVLDEPLVSWLWIGGLIMALGTLLALVPGRRRRPTAPVSEQPFTGRVPDEELVGAWSEPVAAARRPRTALWVAIALGVVIALLVGVLATRDPASTRLVKSPLVGKVVPDIAKPTINNEGDFSLRQQRGKWVLVNFFATWCQPCQAEHDDLVRFAAAHRGTDDAIVVSVVFSDETADVRRYFAQRGGTWPVLADPDGAIATNFGVARVPESYLVAPSGLVVGKVTGGVQFAFLQAQLAKFEQRAAS